ncbi:hypothetical protein BDP27DRAFT_1187790, partial [Rhodocollybia butyracea]
RTHANPAAIAAIGKMSPEIRIKKNFSIESANNARYVKTYDYSVGETSRPGSPTASFMTVASEDLHRIRKDSTNLSSSLPLCFFTLAHLQTIHAFQNELKTTRTHVPDDDGKLTAVSTYDVAKLRERLGIAVDTGKTDGLTFSQFRDAAQNFYTFEAERTEGHAQSTRAQWTSDHFMFFLNQPDAEELYRYWKPIEYDLRLQYQLQARSFNAELY